MKKIKVFFKYFTKGEWLLWIGSMIAVSLSFCLFDKKNYITLTASLTGITSLIFNAKGNPFGQLLMILFSLLYGIISFQCSYYGEMITYLGMTMPMAGFALIAWLKHPYQGHRAQVKINRISKKEWFLMGILTLFITIIFYFILRYFHTNNLFTSTLSVATSFAAVYLTFRRNPYFALLYAINDLVLILLWTLESIKTLSYLSVVVCFCAFLINDLYGFINWKKMEKQQSENNT